MVFIIYLENLPCILMKNNKKKLIKMSILILKLDIKVKY